MTWSWRSGVVTVKRSNPQGASRPSSRSTSARQVTPRTSGGGQTTMGAPSNMSARECA